MRFLRPTASYYTKSQAYHELNFWEDYECAQAGWYGYLSSGGRWGLYRDNRYLTGPFSSREEALARQKAFWAVDDNGNPLEGVEQEDDWYERWDLDATFECPEIPIAKPYRSTLNWERSRVWHMGW